MFMLRLDELTIALHECDGSNIEASSNSTARPTSPPAHRHTAVIAITSPAHRLTPGDSTVTASENRQHLTSTSPHTATAQ